MNAQPSPVTALVLAGGGSFGAVQVGMLRALIAHGVRPNLVVGASVGALNGAYFAGRPGDAGVAELEHLWRGLRRKDVFPVTLRSLFGLLVHRDHLADPRGLRRLMEAHLPYGRLEEAAIPLHVIATDLFEGSAVRLSEGALCDALMASAAIPTVFPPVRVGDRTLIDGGIASNTPIRTAVELNANRLIVLPTGFACALAGPPRGIIASALHALNLLVARQLVMELEQYQDKAEIVTVPPLCPLEVSPYDFSRAGELIERAAEQTGRWLDRGGLGRRRIPGALRAHGH